MDTNIPKNIQNREGNIANKGSIEKAAEGRNQETRQTQETKIEQKEIPIREEEIIKKEIREHFKKIRLDPRIGKDVKKKLKRIKAHNEEEKIKFLLNIAQEKGLSFSIGVAKKMNDSYILDVFHDILIKNGLYKKFLK